MKKEQIIMDIDPGIDDSIAVILALKSKQIDVDAFTLVSGNVDVTQSSKNLTHLLDLMNMTNKKIYVGEDKPLVVDYQDARDTHGQDGLGEVYFPDKKIIESDHAVDYIIKSLNENPGKITILALGPLTNLAKVIEKDSSVLSKAKSIQVMGGSIRVHGNCSPVSEYNFWVDPHAAKIFFDAQLDNVYLYPLDVTYEILLSPNMREMVRQFEEPLGEYIYNITQFYVDFHWNQERTLGCIINDPLVVANLMEDIVEFEPANIDIVVNGIARGESVCNFNPNGNIKVANKVDKDEFFKTLFCTIFPEKSDDIALMFNKEMI